MKRKERSKEIKTKIGKIEQPESKERRNKGKKENNYLKPDNTFYLIGMLEAFTNVCKLFVLDTLPMYTNNLYQFLKPYKCVQIICI